MQPLFATRSQFPARPAGLPTQTANLTPRRLLRWSVLVLVFTSGCGTEDFKPIPSAAKPYTGISLTLACPGPAIADAVRPAVHAWSDRTGATVAIRANGMSEGDEADLGAIPAADLGGWADRGDLAPVPVAFRAADHPYQWSDLLPAYRDQLNAWGGPAYALPMAGDGFVLVYRADRLTDSKVVAAFRAATGRDPAVPTSWEEFADLAAAIAAADGKPSLPPAPPLDLADLFFRVAACYDRPAQIDSANTKAGALETLAFQFDLADGRPRLDASSFKAAASWIAVLEARKCLPPPAAGQDSDPAAALAGNRAMLAVVSLAQLARLSRDNRAVPERFDVAPLPGALRVAVSGRPELAPRTVPNYIPYFVGGLLGVVRTRCPQTAAAFDLLAELGGPARSLELISAANLGLGPVRNSHLDRERLHLWYGYGFDPVRSEHLLKALHQYVNPEIKNPNFGLRGPDQAALTAAAAAAMAKIATGTPADAARQDVLEDWNRLDAKVPPATLLRWRKYAAGLN